MTAVDQHAGYIPSDVAATRTMQIWPTLWLTLVAVLVISLPNLADPMIRHDDFPAFFADPEGFWYKTLHEGRWVSYFWHLRGFQTPAWLNFAVYQACWALLAAAIATLSLGRSGLTWFSGALALMILASPSAALISLWFNTLLPGLALVALFAALGCRLSNRQMRLLLPPFVALTFMSYTTYPLILLCICLLRTERRSLLDLISLLALFAASFAGAVLLTYAINWQVHGVFGVPLAPWRDATPAADVAGMLANLPKLGESLVDFAMRTSYEFVPALLYHILLLIGATVVVARRNALEALYLHAGLFTGLALVAVQVMKVGAIAPPRAFIFVWIFYAVLAVRAACILTAQSGLAGRMGRNAVALVILSYLLQVGVQYADYRPWQHETRAISRAAMAHDGDIYVFGDPARGPAAQQAFLQTGEALHYRMQQLAQRHVIFCARTPADCAEADRLRTRNPQVVPHVEGHQLGVFVSYD
mgnify:CR=1 FL=1|tara:strand:- start:23427 stop:24848 length:1422 start_codon:yes stop_codon:yes gene_type:complete